MAILVAEFLGEPTRGDRGSQPGICLAQLQAVPGNPQQRGETGGGSARALSHLAGNGQRSGRLTGASQPARVGEFQILVRRLLGLGDRPSPHRSKLAGSRYRVVVAIIGVMHIRVAL